MPKGSLANTQSISTVQMLKIRIARHFKYSLYGRGIIKSAFIGIDWVFTRLFFGFVAYAFALFWTTFVETAVCVYKCKS